MRNCFIVAGLTGREHLMNDFIESVKKSKYKDDDFYLYFQQLDDCTPTGIFDTSFFKEMHITKTRDGACLARMYWLHMLDDYDNYIIVDDDMVFIGKEDYDTPIEFVNADPKRGLCCTVCYRTMKQCDAAIPNDTFKVLNLQWISGGLVIKKEIRDLLVQEIDLKPYAYDAFGLVTYLHGYTNYQYWGSIVLHKGGSPNGFKYVAKNPGQFLPKFEKYMKEPYRDGKIVLPIRVSQLTPEAVKLHNERKK